VVAVSFGQALLIEGVDLEDPIAFSEDITAMME
jgi:HSP90 family molecular chaperone